MSGGKDEAATLPSPRADVGCDYQKSSFSANTRYLITKYVNLGADYFLPAPWMSLHRNGESLFRAAAVGKGNRFLIVGIANIFLYDYVIFW